MRSADGTSSLPWVLTLPAAMMISGFLYWVFYQIL